ncbi:hypothetical protein [Deinococcus planocerae]|uniref:hypothetical protein n=1 Tax=Deinococcus planocerae TaxID=1737569 RepID=UPI0011AF9E4E|nr:hypothetical protein [Deinococcus planocerae]
MRTLPGLLALTWLTACTQDAGQSIQLRVVTDYSSKTQVCDFLVGSLSYVPPAGNVPQAVVGAFARPGEVVDERFQASFGSAQEFTASAQCQVWVNSDTQQGGVTTVSQVAVTRTVTEEDFARGLTLRVTPPTESGERPGLVLEPSAAR